MKRRQFVTIAAAGAATIVAWLGYRAWSHPSFDPSLARPTALATILDSAGIAALGVAYRRQARGEGSVRSLVRLLMAGAPTNGDALPASLAQRVQQDFHDGRVVHVDGWVLSLTEARQCALHSLTARG